MSDKPPSETGNNEAASNKILFETSEQIRQFEINLVWQRALYFWGFTVATFGGYAALVTSDRFQHPNVITTLVACFGLVSAAGWTLSNRGSKFWFHVWEKKAEQASQKYFTSQPLWVWEDTESNIFERFSNWIQQVFPHKAKKDADITNNDGKRDQLLYGVSTKLKRKIYSDDGKWGFWVRRYSVSRLSIMVSDFVVVLWILILLVDVGWLQIPQDVSQMKSTIAFVTLGYLLLYVIRFGNGKYHKAE